METVQRLTVNVSTNTLHIPIICTTDTHIWTGPTPWPWLAVPPVITMDLATLTAQLAEARPTLPVDALTNRVMQTIRVDDPSRQRVVCLMTKFGTELLRVTSEHLLEEVAARFRHLENVPLSAMITFITDELAVWARRPGLIRQAVIDVDDELEWLHYRNY